MAASTHRHDRVSAGGPGVTAPHSPIMSHLVASIRASAADRLAGLMSMHDIAVTTTPVPAVGPIDVIWIRPQPSQHPDTQHILIEH